MTDMNSNKPSRFLVGLGVLLICFGVVNLVDKLLPPELFMAVSAFVRGMWGVAWPLLLIVLGAYILWAAKTGRLSSIRSVGGYTSLRRSRTDKRIFGVCGGLAQHYGADASAVRVVAVLLLVFLTPMALVTYFAMALIIPGE